MNDITAGCLPIHLAKINRHGRLKIINQIHALVGALVSFFVLASIATAAPITITVDTSSLSGTSAQLAFDLIDGGPPANSVTISGFVTSGTLGASSSTGDVVGNFPGSVVLSDTSFFNEYLQDITLGNTLSYTFDNTGLSADVISFPDGFSFFLLDPITGLSLASTSDPTGANALFLLGIGTTSGFEIYSGQNFSVTVQGVPEPSTLYLIAIVIGILGVVATRRRHKALLKLAISFFVLSILVLKAPYAIAADVTSTTQVSRSGLVLNRITNTFDSVVTLTNTGQVTYSSPFKLIVLVSPTAVSLSNGTGVTSDGKAFIEIPLPSGRLNQGQSVRTTIKINNVPRVTFAITFKVDASISDTSGLPPDPGPAGLVTLLGIDTDGDGVRDDLQRYIALTYPSDPNAVNALRQLSKTTQEMLTIPQGDVAAAKSVNDKAWRNRSCLVYLYKAVEGHRRAKALFAEQFNTIARYRAWSKQDDLLAGQSFESPRDRSTTCDFTVIR